MFEGKYFKREGVFNFYIYINTIVSNLTNRYAKPYYYTTLLFIVYELYTIAYVDIICIIQ